MLFSVSIRCVLLSYINYIFYQNIWFFPLYQPITIRYNPCVIYLCNIRCYCAGNTFMTWWVWTAGWFQTLWPPRELIWTPWSKCHIVQYFKGTSKAIEDCKATILNKISCIVCQKIITIKKGNQSIVCFSVSQRKHNEYWTYNRGLKVLIL